MSVYISRTFSITLTAMAACFGGARLVSNYRAGDCNGDAKCRSRWAPTCCASMVYELAGAIGKQTCAQGGKQGI
jgi:hypothetical protein